MNFESVMEVVTKETRRNFELPKTVVSIVTGGRDWISILTNNPNGLLNKQQKGDSCHVKGEKPDYDLPVENAKQNFQQVLAHSKCQDGAYVLVEGRDLVSKGVFPTKGVSVQVVKFENTAQGDDGLTCRHMRNLDPKVKFQVLIVKL